MGSNSLKEYLKRYESNPEEGTTMAKKKKKQKKKKPQTQGTGLVVVDEDPVWQKPVNLEEENSDNSSGNWQIFMPICVRLFTMVLVIFTKKLYSIGLCR